MACLLICLILQAVLTNLNMPLEEEVPPDAFQNNNLEKEAVDVIASIWEEDVVAFEGGMVGIEEYVNAKHAQKSPQCGRVRTNFFIFFLFYLCHLF